MGLKICPSASFSQYNVTITQVQTKSHKKWGLRIRGNYGNKRKKQKNQRLIFLADIQYISTYYFDCGGWTLLQATMRHCFDDVGFIHTSMTLTSTLDHTPNDRPLISACKVIYARALQQCWNGWPWLKDRPGFKTMNEMQSETADFHPVPPPGELGKTRRRFWPIRSIVWKRDIIHKTGCT